LAEKVGFTCSALRASQESQASPNPSPTLPGGPDCKRRNPYNAGVSLTPPRPSPNIGEGAERAPPRVIGLDRADRLR